MSADLGHYNLLVTVEMKTLADVRKAFVVLSDDDIHARGLICVGGYYFNTETESTHWAVPTGEAGEPTHEAYCPVCERRDG